MSDEELLLELLKIRLYESTQSANQCRDADLDSGDPNGTLAIAYQLEALTTVLELILLHLHKKDHQ